MLKNFTYKQKNIGLLIVFILMLLISWTSALDKTIDLYIENNEYEKAINLSATAPEQIGNLTLKLRQLERNLFYNKDEAINRQDKLLQLTGKLCKEKDLTLRTFPEVQQEMLNDYIIETNIIKVEGSYTKLVELVYNLEQTYRAGKISSVKFETLNDRRTKMKILIATIYLQNIKPQNDEV